MLLLLFSQLEQQVEGPFPLFHLNLNVAALWMMLYKKDKQDFSGVCSVGTLIHMTIIKFAKSSGMIWIWSKNCQMHSSDLLQLWKDVWVNFNSASNNDFSNKSTSCQQLLMPNLSSTVSHLGICFRKWVFCHFLLSAPWSFLSPPN